MFYGVLRLRTSTPDDWLPIVLANFDEFLVDHAAAERKASANALNLAMHYRDRSELVAAMVDLAHEELTHFKQVYELMSERGLAFRKDERDPYVRGLLPHVRGRSSERLMDRMLVFGIVEARGCERFGLVAEGLEPGPLKTFYLELTRAEARHHGLFVRLAKLYFPREEVDARLNTLLDVEGELVQSLKSRAALH